MRQREAQSRIDIGVIEKSFAFFICCTGSDCLRGFRNAREKINKGQKRFQCNRKCLLIACLLSRWHLLVNDGSYLLYRLLNCIIHESKLLNFITEHCALYKQVIRRNNNFFAKNLLIFITLLFPSCVDMLGITASKINHVHTYIKQ